MGQVAEHLAQAYNMIDGQLRTNGITDPRILQAMIDVPRQVFLPPALHNAAYVDEDLPFGRGRAFIEPLTFARLISLADIKEDSSVLVIGALNGYAAAIAAKLSQHVVATELDATLIEEAKKNLKSLGIEHVKWQQVKSLAEGYSLSAPYDAIIINGAVEFITESLGAQLSISGKLTTVRNVTKRPGTSGGLGKVAVINRVGGRLQFREYYDASTAILPGFTGKSTFSL